MIFDSYISVFKQKYHERRGLRLLGSSDFTGSRAHFEKALLYSGNLNYYFHIAICYIGQHQIERAKECLEKIIDDHYDDLLICSTLAECYLVLRQWEQAERLLEYLHTKSPENETIKYLHAMVHDPIERDKYACSKDLFYRSVEAMQNKDIDAAIQYILQAIELTETNSAYYHFAGHLMMQARREKAEVERYLLKAVELSPRNEVYKRELHFVKTRYRN